MSTLAKAARTLLQGSLIRHELGCPHGPKKAHTTSDGSHFPAAGGYASLTDEDSYDVCSCWVKPAIEEFLTEEKNAR